MRKLLFVVALALCVAGVVSIFAVVGIAVTMANHVNPLLGRVVLWSLVSFFGASTLYAFVLYLRMPPALIPPRATEGPDFDAYVAALRKRLSANPRLKNVTLQSLEDVQVALQILSREADDVIRGTAKAVFLATALLQNGRLDGLVVLLTQSQMVLRLAQLYFQRPSFRQMVHLYGNVAGTALIAAELDDLISTEAVAPLVSALVTAIPGAVPGLGQITNVIVRSVSNGSANAFLTLRVGEVARSYCEAVHPVDRQAVRRAATAAAIIHLGRIVRDNGGSIVRAVRRGVMQGAGAAMKSSRHRVRGLFYRIRSLYRGRQDSLPAAGT